MSSVLSIVLGAGGLLGSEVFLACADAGFAGPATAGVFDWDNPKQVAAKTRSLVSEAETDATILVFWCAGRGFVGSAPEQLAGATGSLIAMLDGLVGCDNRIHITYSSSAGAVWSASNETPITEATEPSSMHGYGDAKLSEEELIRQWSSGGTGRSATIARIANLFGRNQDVTKAQGLLSKLIANCVRGEPTTLFVPLDTARDYLPAASAAEMMVAAALQVIERPQADESTDVRIIASGQSYTIAQVCGILQRMRRRRVPLAHVVAASTSEQPRRLSFASNRDPLGVQIPTLEESLRMMFDDERRRIALAT